MRTTSNSSPRTASHSLLAGLQAFILSVSMSMSMSVSMSASADELAPTPEQVTERTVGFLSVWNALRAGESGLRVRVEPALVSSGKYEGARIWWYRTGTAFEVAVPITKSFNLGISPSFAFEQLVVKGSDDFIITESGRDTTISDFFDGSLNFGGKFDLAKNWGAEFVVGASVRQESGAAFEDSVQAGGSLAVVYRRGSWLRLRLGVGLGADLDDGKLRISPVYRIVIKPLPALTLETSGFKGSVTYDFSKTIGLILAGGLDGTQYNLEKRSEPPIGLGGGTFQRRQSGLSLALTYRVRSWLRITAESGLILRQELTVLNSDGLIVDQRSDRSPSANGRLRFEFRI